MGYLILTTGVNVLISSFSVSTAKDTVLVTAAKGLLAGALAVIV